MLFILKIFSWYETRRNEIVVREDARLFVEDLLNEYRLRRGRHENVDDLQQLVSIAL